MPQDMGNAFWFLIPSRTPFLEDYGKALEGESGHGFKIGFRYGEL